MPRKGTGRDNTERSGIGCISKVSTVPSITVFVRFVWGDILHINSRTNESLSWTTDFHPDLTLETKNPKIGLCHAFMQHQKELTMKRIPEKLLVSSTTHSNAKHSCNIEVWKGENGRLEGIWQCNQCSCYGGKSEHQDSIPAARLAVFWNWLTHLQVHTMVD